MKKLLSKSLAVLLALGTFSAAFADEAHDVMAKYLDLNVPEYSQSTLIMDIIENGKIVEHRELKQIGGGDNGLKNTVFDFRSPASVKDTRILQAEKKNKDDDKWVYLPSLRTTRRIGSGDRSKPFVGSEFTYNDMGRRKITDDKHEMVNPNVSVTISSKDFGSFTYNCWQIKETPIPSKAKEVEYAYRHYWIDKKTYMPVKIQNFDKKGTLMKTMVIEKLEQTKGIKGTYQVRRAVNVVNEKTKRVTHLWIKDYKWDQKVSTSYFTQQWLITGKIK